MIVINYTGHIEWGNLLKNQVA